MLALRTALSLAYEHVAAPYLEEDDESDGDDDSDGDEDSDDGDSSIDAILAEAVQRLRS